MSAELRDRVAIWPHPESAVGDEGWLERTVPGVRNGAPGWGRQPMAGTPREGPAGWGSKDQGEQEWGGAAAFLAPCLSPAGIGLRTGTAAGLGLEHWSSNLLCTFSPSR